MVRKKFMNVLSEKKVERMIAFILLNMIIMF